MSHPAFAGTIAIDASAPAFANTKWAGGDFRIIVDLSRVPTKWPPPRVSANAERN